MQRNPFQDVVPPGKRGEKNTGPKMGQEVKRSVRDIPLLRKPKSTLVKETLPINKSVTKDESYHAPINQEMGQITSSKFGYPPIKKERRFNSPRFFIGTAIVVVLIFVVFIMNAFTSAKIQIAPKTENVSFNIITKISNTATSSALLYQVLEFSSEREKEVPANGTEYVERKASARITIYNNFSSEPQRLIARTRFATPNGLIFRINDSVTVPGKSGNNPGSIEVTVFADEAGEKYNIDLVDFTIPGFKDDQARYQGFYARSITKAEGGFVGTVKKVNQADSDLAKSELETLLKSDIEKNVVTQIDPNLIALNGSSILEFSELSNTDSTKDKVLIKQKIKAYIVVLNKKDLSDLIKTNFLSEWQNISAEIASYEDMVLVFTETNWKPNYGLTEVKISGNAKMVAVVDTDDIIGRISGKPKNELSDLINNSSFILGAKAIIRPMWKNKFPDNPDKIMVEVINSIDL